MEELSTFFLSENEKSMLIEALSSELSVLRTKAGISQEELASIIGISRQTYGAIERKNRKMSWNTYLSLIMVYDYNKTTHSMIRESSAYPHKLIKLINNGDEPNELELGQLFSSDKENILSSLDERAIATIKTILMVEYSRCNNISNDAAIRFFEGIDLQANASKKDQDTSRAIKKIKKDNING